jgi:hypothetical protein
LAETPFVGMPRHSDMGEDHHDRAHGQVKIGCGRKTTVLGGVREASRYG